MTWKRSGTELEVVVKTTELENGVSCLPQCSKRLESFWRALGRSCKALKRPRTERRSLAIFMGDREPTKSLRDDRPGSLNDDALAQRFVLGKFGEHIVRLPERLTHRHVLVCGPTGSGKSTAIFIPNLVERTACSALVTEAVSGNGMPTLYKATAGWRASKGHELVNFNPGDLTSTRINPIDQVRTIDDAQRLATLIIANTTADSHVGDQVWS